MPERPVVTPSKNGGASQPDRRRTGSGAFPRRPNVFWMTIAFVSLGLGVIGIFIPIMPTAPFLLLSVYLFSKHSERYHTWLTQHPLLKHYLVPRPIPIWFKVAGWVVIWIGTVLLWPLIPVKWMRFSLVSFSAVASLLLLVMPNAGSGARRDRREGRRSAGG